MTETVIARYAQGALTGRQLQSEIDRALESISQDPEALNELQLDAASVRSADFKVKEEGGFDPASILLAIALGMASGMAWDGTKLLWRKVAEKVKEENGDDAIGPEQEGREEPS